MPTSIRIQLGLQTYQLEYGHGGAALPVAEARALLHRARDGRDASRLQAFARAVCRSTLDWEDDRHALDDLLRTGWLRLRRVDAPKPVSDPVQAPAPEYVPVENEISKTHTVEIELVDDDGNPVPGEPYEIKLPDGSTRRGTLDNLGKARIAGLQQAGTCQVCFYKRDAAAWGPA